MPKLIDYPRTTYAGAWELGEVVDDTGGKCAIDTAARKLNRKVSGSFKAIIGSAVKFGLVTSKRELLSTTTLFKRIKHAYDKQEERLFHREAFLTPPLFTQLCRKFRSRELPVQMLDVMLIREFGVEEINAQGVAKAFTEGARMVGLLDEHNVVADIDQLAAQQPPRRELATPPPVLNTFRPTTAKPIAPRLFEAQPEGTSAATDNQQQTIPPVHAEPDTRSADVVASLFGLPSLPRPSVTAAAPTPHQPQQPTQGSATPLPLPTSLPASTTAAPRPTYQLQVHGPGIDTQFTVADEDDLVLVQAVLDKIRRQLKV